MGLFSIWRKDSEYFNDNQESIELVSCPMGGATCVKHREVINKNIVSARKYLLDKNYLQSVEELKTAFYSTTDLTKLSCVNCAQLYRSTILQSVEQIHDDLQKTTTGLFKSKRHQPSLHLVARTLEELKKNQ